MHPSKLDSKVSTEFEIGFSDAHALQSMRRRILKAIEAVDQSLEVVASVGKVRHLASAKVQLKVCENRFKNHRRVLLAIADLQHGTSEFVSTMVSPKVDGVILNCQTLDGCFFA